MRESLPGFVLSDEIVGDDLVRSHHLVVFVREDVAMPHVVAGKIELGDDVKNLSQSNPYCVLVSRLRVRDWKGTFRSNTS
jgi:hypothetical protein